MRKSYLIVGLILCTVLLGVQGCSKHPQGDELAKALNPQADFKLTDQEGNEFHLSQLRGKLVMMFFGYLTCPDICPMTISKLTKIYKLLGSQSEKVVTLFVSVDPKRDTPQRLKEYLTFFKVKGIGLTGTQEEIDQVVNAYKASYEKVETQSAAGYLFNHSDHVYLIDKQGKVQYLIHSEDKPEKVVEWVKQLLKNDKSR